MVDTAVIMAAGLSSRFAGVTTDMPKGCYSIGGRALVQRSIDILREYGIKDIVIVTGHLAHFYEEIASLNKEVRTVHNPQYATTGSMLSLYSAGEAVKGKDILVLESDLIYEKKGILQLLESPIPTAVLLTGNQDLEDSYLFERLDNHKIGRILRKSNQTNLPSGEFPGISKMSSSYYQALCQNFREINNPKIGYDYVIEATDGMGYVYIEDLVWSEMDSPTDLKRIKEVTYPELIKKGEL